eukprot:1153767-Pelagomonas_calceolata.AAC.8
MQEQSLPDTSLIQKPHRYKSCQFPARKSEAALGRLTYRHPTHMLLRAYVIKLTRKRQDQGKRLTLGHAANFL